MDLPGSLPPPSWVDSGAEPIRGLDLLGLRRPVQLLGGSLLTGVTTITPSIRYLSIHAWLAHSYAQAKQPDRWSDFRSFAETAESAVVLGNLIRDPGTVGLIGSNKGREILDSGHRPLPLGRLVKQLAISIYANPSFQLGLAFSRESGVPGLSKERGLLLAESVKSRVRESALGDTISAGKIPADAVPEQLRELGQRLAIQDVPSEESELLLAALLPKTPRASDLPRFGTYASLLFLARDLDRVPEERDLFAVAREVERSLPTELRGTLDGWLRYSVRDLISTVGESAFKVVIDTLERLAEGDARTVPANRVLNALLDVEGEHSEALCRLGLARADESVWSFKFSDLYGRVASALLDPKASSGGLDRWTSPLHEWAVMDSALGLGPGSLSMLPVAWCLATLRAAPWEAAAEGTFEGRPDIGWARLGLDEVIRPTVGHFLKEETGLLEATKELALRTIDQHLRVAWSRMVTDMKRDVSALTTDGDKWRSRGKTVFADRTASRLPQAIGWLQQLGLVDKSGVTARGERVLDQAFRTLRQARP